MKGSRVERFAGGVPLRVIQSVREAASNKTAARKNMTSLIWGAGLDEARDAAAAIKDYVLDNLADLLRQFEQSALRSGMHVHWAADAQKACDIVIDLVRTVTPTGSVVAKAKSMATEEIHLNSALQSAGYLPIETDLGEFVVQLEGQTPSHIVMPIMHMDRQDVSASFDRHGLGPKSDEPAELTAQARAHLRNVFKSAKVGISGVNFAVAETGRLILVENEGNNRFCTTAVERHIAVMGIEKLVPCERDIPLFLRLLAPSATGQQISTYTHFISGPRAKNETDGPREVHIILLDNGRTQAVASRYRTILRCIRCGACQNVCPVYRASSGHAYGHVYSGPIGAILAPTLEGIHQLGDLANASTLCGACEAVCPVAIPIPELLLEMRREKASQGNSSLAMFAAAANSRKRWLGVLKVMPVADLLPAPLVRAWRKQHRFPPVQGRSFRRWWHERSK